MKRDIRPDYNVEFAEAVKGYGLTALFIADFVALLMVNNILVQLFLGVVFILGAVQFYFGSKNIESFEFTAHPFRIKIKYKSTK